MEDLYDKADEVKARRVSETTLELSQAEESIQEDVSDNDDEEVSDNDDEHVDDTFIIT